MRGPSGDREALLDAVEHAEHVRADTGSGRQSLEDSTVLRSVLYSLAVIGEAVNRVSAELREAHPELPWRRIVNMRNVLIHVYDEVRLDLVWEAVDQLPALVATINVVLKGLPAAD